MPRRNATFLVGLYALIATVVFVINARTDRDKPSATHWPDFKTLHEKKPGTETLFPDGLTVLDLSTLKTSINRLPAISLARQLGNSLRIACGQRLNWVIWGGRNPAMLFPESELWAAEGINAGDNRTIVEGASVTAKKYAALLKAEGWTLIVVPVPTKLSIHREHCHWPIMEKDLLTRRPVTGDRTDEIIDTLFNNFTRDGVNFVDLRAVYRAHLVNHPDDLIFPPGESHWSGLGIQLAAEATAVKVTSVTNITFHPRIPSFLEVDRIGDMVSAFDAYPGWLSRLRPFYHFQDHLVNGEQGKGYTYAPTPKSLLVVAGTSYTGQYTWLIGEPVGFTWVIGGMLNDCEIHNRPVAGLGSFYAFRQFLDEHKALAQDFAQRNALTAFPKVVVWEFPLRDLAVAVGQ